MEKVSKDLVDVDVEELKKEYPDEGMDGIDPRYVSTGFPQRSLKKIRNQLMHSMYSVH